MFEPFDSARESLLELLDFVAETKSIDRWNIPADWQPVPLNYRPLVEKRKRRWAEHVKELIAELDTLLDRVEECRDCIDPYLARAEPLDYCGIPTNSYADFTFTLGILHLNRMNHTASVLHNDDEATYQSLDVRDLRVRVVNELRQAKLRWLESGRPVFASTHCVDGARKRRHRKTDRTPKPLTPIQLEAAQIASECKGNFAEAARRLGKDRKTVKESYDAAMKKLGKTLIRHSTRPIATDRRGQENITNDADRRGV